MFGSSIFCVFTSSFRFQISKNEISEKIEHHLHFPRKTACPKTMGRRIKITLKSVDLEIPWIRAIRNECHGSYRIERQLSCSVRHVQED